MLAFIQSYLYTDVEKWHCTCLVHRVKPWWNYTNIDENKQRNNSDGWHESHYVPTVPANPQLNLECDTECERRGGGGGAGGGRGGVEATEKAWWETKCCVSVCMRLCACHLFSLHHNLWRRQPAIEQEAEETVEVWVCICVCDFCVFECKRWAGCLAASWAD